MFRRSGFAPGFTLLEVLVAFTVLAVSLGVLFEIFATGLGAARTSENLVRATQLAQSKLATVGVETPLAVGEQSGRFDDDFAWRVAVRPFADDSTEPERVRTTRAFEVAVTVSWDKGGRSLRLATLRLGPGQ
ncbi:MAG: type II secretion system protein [Alphaproteobacteria bacterium]